MTDRKAKILERLLEFAGYAGFFFGCFLLFAYLTFPYERVRDFLVDRASSGSGPNRTTLKIGELGPHWLTGVSLSEVEYTKGELEKPKGKKAKAEAAPPRTLKLDELTVSVSPLALALGSTSVSFGAEVAEGQFDGSYEQEEEGPTRFSAEFDEVDLAELGLGAYLELPLAGTLSGTVDLQIAPEPAQTEGTIELTITDLTLGDGKSKIPMPGGWGGLTLDPVKAGTLTLKVTVAEGVGTIETFEAKGRDLEISGSGSLRMVQPLAKSRADLTLGIKLQKGFTSRNEKAKTAMMLPQVKRALGADNMLRLKLSGQIDSLRARPLSGSARKARPARGAKRPPRTKRPD
ncbi:MAG: type II secretion system protein GspN [Myxococcales bacterium]|nr:type II secretion system protein GspN [Myxococcales bacterium]